MFSPLFYLYLYFDTITNDWNDGKYLASKANITLYTMTFANSLFVCHFTCYVVEKNTTIYNIQMYSVVYFYPMNTLTSSKCCLHSHAPPIYLSIKLVISHIYVYLRFSDLIYKRVYVHSHVKQRDRKFINNTSIVLKWDQIKFNNTTLISAFSK